KNAIISDELFKISDLQQLFLSRQGSHSMYTTPAEVADLVMFTFLEKFMEGYLIKASVYEAFTLNKGIVTLPTVITEFSAALSATSVSLYGNVLEDGGGEITSRGIAWATFYNPTTGDQVLAAGAGTGEFTTTLSGLTEGETYYARSFAINSAGTAYGNCISFVAASSSGMEKIENPNRELAIYPNPASDQITLSFTASDPEGMVFTIFDMSGKIVLQHELRQTMQGENMLHIDVTALKNGIYTCQLEGVKHQRVRQKLLVNR
ncbi:MAG: T9SS type A sorting domain-containing protein, partial [Anaerolineales bacterium]